MLWIVGKVFSEFRNYLQDNAIPYSMFWDQSVELPGDISVRVEYIDFSNETELIAQLTHIHKEDISAVVVAGYENYVLPAAYIAKHFNVPGPTIDAARAATNKAIMRSRFIEYDRSLSPDFAEVTSWEEIEQFMKTHRFPVMLKPASLMKSLLITKNMDAEELLQNYHQTMAEISRLYEKYSIGQPPKIIIEEFLAGSMHTVAAFADRSGKALLIPGIVDCTTGQEIGHNDNFLYSRTLPTKLSEHEQQSIFETASRGITALGLSSCPAHVEIMLTKEGPKIIEIGARIGGYRPRMYEYAFGIDLQQMMLDVVSGTTPTMKSSENRSMAVFELFPEQEGTFRELTNQKDLEALQSLRHLSVKARKGSSIGLSSQGYKAAAVVILGNDDPEQFQKDAQFLQEKVQVIVHN